MHNIKMRVSVVRKSPYNITSSRVFEKGCSAAVSLFSPIFSYILKNKKPLWYFECARTRKQKVISLGGRRREWS